MFTPDQVAQLKEAFRIWSWTEQSEGRPFVPSTDKDAFKVLAVRAVKYGAPEAHSAWTRAAKELADEGAIVLHKPAPQPVEIDDSFRTEVQRMSSSELLKRLQREPGFAARFETLAQESAAPRPSDPEREFTLTAAQYNGIPAATAIRKYQSDPAFARAVDKLFASNSVRNTNVRRSEV